MEELTFNTFKEKIWDFEKYSQYKFIGQKPAMIYFYRDSFPPCQRMSPIYSLISDEYSTSVDFYMVNIDTESALTVILKIPFIPMIWFCSNTGDKRYYQAGPCNKKLLKLKIQTFFNL